MSSKTTSTRGVMIVALAAVLFLLKRNRARHVSLRPEPKSVALRPDTTAKPRPAGLGAPPLHFGTAGRKKARNARYRARIGALGLVAALIGIPGANSGLDLVRDALSEDERPAITTDLTGVTTSESAASMLRFRGNLFKNRPTPSPTPAETPEEEAPEPEAPPVAAPPPAPAGSVTEIIYAAAAEFGIDPNYLLSVASCESGLNPGAVNPAGYHGLFQFDHATWSAYGYGSIYDPVAQARAAARMLAAGMASRWPNCA